MRTRRIVFVRAGKILAVLVVVALMAAAVQANYVFQWRSVFEFDTNTYGWGDQTQTGGDSNWINPSSDTRPENYPDAPDDFALLNDSLSYDEFIQLFKSQPGQPRTGAYFSMNELLIDGGAQQHRYFIEPYDNNSGLVFAGSDATIRLNNDFNLPDVISAPIVVVNGLTISGGPLEIDAPISSPNSGTSLTVSNVLSLSGNNSDSFPLPDKPLGSIVLTSGALLFSNHSNLGADSTVLDLRSGTLSPYTSTTLAQPMTIGAAGGPGPEIAVAPQVTLTLAGAVTAIADLRVDGGGTLALATTNAYVGKIFVGNATSLELDESLPLSNPAATIILDSARITTSTNAAFGEFTATAHFSLAQTPSPNAIAANFDIPANVTLTLAGLIDGDEPAIKTGLGTLNLAGNNDFTGGITVNSGILRISSYSPTTITTSGGANSGEAGGQTVFADSAIARSASTIVTNGGIGVGRGGGTTIFQDSSSAGDAKIITNGGTGDGPGGSTQFFFLATGGTARAITNAGGSFDISGLVANGLSIGSIEGAGNYYLGQKTLTFGSLATNRIVSGVITDSGVNGGTGGSIVKVGNGTTTLSGVNTYTGTTRIKAGSLTISGSIAAGSGALVDGGGTLNYISSASAGSTPISVAGGAFAINSPSGSLNFMNNSSAGSATVTAAGGTAVNAPGATVVFADNATAGTATLVTNGGTSGGFGGLTEFVGGATGGSARVITNAGGTFDISREANGFIPNVMVGSIEGAGAFQLGANTLIFGGLGTDTLVSGSIVDDSVAGGSGGSIVKTGTGTTTLNGINGYTGPTTINGGKLKVIGSIASSSVVIVNSGGTLELGGGGTASTIVNNGSVLLTGGGNTVSANVTNQAGRTVSVSGAAAFSGNVTNSGTFKTTAANVSFAGAFSNNGVYVSDPSTQTFQNLTIGANGALVGGLGDVFNVRGDLIDNSTQNTVWDTHLSQVGFNASGPHQLTWSGAELGRGNAGFINNFATGIFVVPSAASMTTDGGGALYTRVLTFGDGLSQIASLTGNGLNIHYNPGSPQNAYLNFQSYTLPNGYVISPAAAPADVNAVWNGTTGNWTDATRWSSSPNYPLNSPAAVTLYDATINSGTVTLDQPIGYIQKLNLGSGGTLTGGATVTTWDTFTWGTPGNNNTSTISSGVTVNANGDISIVGDSARNLDNATINNHANYNVTWATGNSDVNFSNGAVLNNYGTFTAQNNRSLGHNGGSGAFNNYGTFTKNTGTGTTNVGSANFVFNNLGVLNVQTGALEFDGPLQGPTTASVSIAGGASLVIADQVSAFSSGITNAGALNVGDAVGAASSAILRLLADNQINNSSIITVKSDGLFDINGLVESVGALAINSGNVTIGAGTLMPSSLTMTGGTISSTGNGKLQLSSGVTAASNGSGNAATITAAVDLNGATRVFSVNQGGGGVDLLVTGPISNGGLTKTGAGKMTLTGVNSYSGGTTMQQGVLNINGTSAVGTSAFTINAGTIDNTTGGPLTLATNNSEHWGGSFTFAGTQSLNFGTGAVTLNSNPTATISANTLTVGPIANGTGNSLNKAGTGTLFVSGGASYTGTTAVNAGTMTVSAGPFASSSVTVASGAVMKFINGAIAGGGMFTGNGSPNAATSGGLLQFSDNGTTAGTGNYTINGGTGTLTSGGNGATLVFNGGTTADHATISVQGAPSRYAATSAQALFNAGSTAGSANITVNGGSDGGNDGNGLRYAIGGVALFTGDSTAGAATLVTNGGTNTGLPGLAEFKDTADAGTANITINNGATNKFVTSASAAGATVAVNGGGTIDFEDTASAGTTSVITVGSNGLATFIGNAKGGSATITNNSGGQTQFYNSASAESAHITTMDSRGGLGTAHTRFYDTSSAGAATFTIRGGQEQDHAGGGVMEFHDHSTAGSATMISNLGATAANSAFGGETDFYDNSSAGTNAQIVNGGATGGTGPNGGVTRFFNSSTAGTSSIANNAPTVSGGNNGGGYTYFNTGTSADHATIINYGGGTSSSAGTDAGHTEFDAGSTADHVAIMNNSATTAVGHAGETDFGYGATAANATIVNSGSAVSGAAGGTTRFIKWQFSQSGLANAASASITSNGGTVSGANGGYTYFGGNSAAVNATLTANGGTTTGAFGGTTHFESNASAGASTLITNGGTNGGGGGVTEFYDSADGGTARVITNAGGIFDKSNDTNLTVGSIEGAGTYQLGAGTFTSGSLNTDTTVSGLLVDGGSGGGFGASVIKVGTGKLALNGANTYSGTTTVAGGILSTSLLANGGVPSGVGSSSNAAANLVLNGGTLQYTGSGASIDRLYTVGINGAGLDASGTGPISFTNSGAMVYSGSGSRTFSLSGTNTGNNTFAQAIVDSPGGVTSVAKSGSGTWVLNTINGYTGPTTITAGTLRYGGSDSSPSSNIQAYTLTQPGNQQSATAAMGVDFNVNSSITVTQLGVFDFGRDGLASSHNVYIYNRNTQQALATLNIAAGNSGALSADGYRFMPLSTPLTLPAGNYSVVADFSSSDKSLYAGGFDGNLGTMNDGGGTVSYLGQGRIGNVGSYPTGIETGVFPYRYAAADFLFNSPGSSRIPGDVTINGSTAVLDLGTNQNGNVATVVLDGGGSITGTGTSTLFSRTSYQMKSGSVSAILAGSGIPLIKSTSGTVVLSGANTYTGGTTVDGGVLAVIGSIVGNVVVNSSATLQGTGTVGGNVSVASGGTLSPGNSAGTLTVGSLALNSGSQTKIELSGTTRGMQYDDIVSNGAVSLGGTLTVTLVNSFPPVVGNTFDILDWPAGNLTGVFSTLSLPILAAGRAWDTSQLYTTGVLAIVATAGIPGDYNNNGVVDAADFVVWRKNQGTTNSLPNDPTGGTIGTAQYDRWRANFGQSAGAGVALRVAIPEPDVVPLLIAGLLAAFTRRQAKAWNA